MIDSRGASGSAGTLLSTDDLGALVEGLTRIVLPRTDTEAIHQLELLERIKSAAAASQALITADFARDRRETLEPARQLARAEGRFFPHPEASIGAEVALSRRESPHQGRRHVELADALTHDLPHTLVALSLGDISEERAMIVATETRDLSAEDRRAVDAELFQQPGHRAVAGLGDVDLRNLLRRIVFRIDADGVGDRWDKARARRRVTSRTLGDGTTRISAIVKQEHAAAIASALDQAASSARAAGDERTRDQVKADTIVERVTGLDTTGSPQVNVDLVVGVDTLFGESNEPGDILGVGPVPASVCRDLVARASAEARAALRRLFTTPDDRELVAMESNQRIFPQALDQLISFRDGGICRTPVVQLPHPPCRPPRAGPPERRDVVRQRPGTVRGLQLRQGDPGWVTWVNTAGGRHEVGTLTPAHHVHTSHPPPQPGGPGDAPPGSRLEIFLSDFVLTA